MKKSALKKLSTYSSDSSSSKLVKIGEAANLLGISIDTLRRWEKKGWLKVTKTPGGTRLYDKDQLTKLNPNLKRGPKSLLTPLAPIQPQATVSTNTPSDFHSSFSEQPKLSLSSDDSILKISEYIKPKQIESDIIESFSQAESFISKETSSFSHSKAVAFVKRNIQLVLITALLVLPLLLITAYANNNKTLVAGFNSRLNPLSNNSLISTKNLVQKLTTIFSPTLSHAVFGTYPAGSPPGIYSRLNNKNSDQLASGRVSGDIKGSNFARSKGDVLADSTPSGSFLQINLDAQINGSLSVNTASVSGALYSATINTGFGDNEVYPMNQPLLTTSPVTFASLTAGSLSGSTLSLTSGSNQLTLANTIISTQTGGSGAFTVSVPALTSNGNFVIDNAVQTLTNKSISGSSNTLTNIPNSALSSSSITINAGSGLSGGGEVSLGGSITLTATGGGSGAVDSITGTTDQVIASASTGDITLSLPQSIGTTSDVEFDSLELTTGLLLNGSTSGTVTLAAPGTVTSYTLTLPTDDGTNGYVLQTDGSGNTSWVAQSGGVVTLQGAYDGGNTITTTTGNNIAFTLGSGLATSTSLSLTNAGTATAFVINDTNAANNIVLDIQSNSVSNLTITEAGNITSSGVIATTGTGTITSSSTLTASDGFTLSSGALNMTASSGAIAVSGLTSASVSVTSGTLALATATSGNITLTTGDASNLINVLNGNLKVGNGTPGLTLDGEDAYIEGTLEVDGASNIAGAATFGSTTTLNGLTYTWPGSQTNGYVLTTNGSGTLSWTDPSTLSISVRWNQIQNPNATQTLAMADYATTWNWATADTETAFTATANALTTGTLFNLSSSSTAGADSGSTLLLDLARSGSNANASHTSYGIRSQVSNSGTTSTNIAGYFAATNASNNYAIIVPASSGSVGIGTTAPSSKLDVADGNDGAGAQIYAKDGGIITMAQNGAYPFQLGNNTSAANSVRYRIDSNGAIDYSNSASTPTITLFSNTQILNALTGNFKVGNGTPGLTLDGEDAYIEGTLEVDGAVNFGNLSASSAVYTDGSSNLTTTAPTSGTIGYWSRSGTTLSTATAGDNVTTSGSISTSGSGTITSAGTLTASNGFTMTTGALSLTSTSGAISSTGLTGLTLTLSSGTAALTAPTLNLNTSATGNTTVGNATGTFALTSAGLNITTAGVISDADSAVVINDDLTISGTTGLTFNGAGADITFTNGESINNDTNNQIDINLGASGTLLLTSSTAATIANSAGALNVNATATGLNLQTDGSVDVNLAGGSSATGCTVNNTTGDLTCTGTISGGGSVGYWTRSGSTLSPTTSGDNVTTSGNISTTGSGTGTFAGLLTATSGVTLGSSSDITFGNAETIDNDTNGVLNFAVDSTSALKIGSTGITSIGNVAHSLVNSGGSLALDSNSTATLLIGASTNAKSIFIGNNTGSTNLNLNSGTGAMTFKGYNATGNTTSSAFVFDGAGVSTGTGLYITSTATSGKTVDINATQTSGTVFNLAYGSAKTLTGDLTGLYVDLNSGNVDATNQNLTGVNFKIPTVTDTHTTGTKTLTGMLVNFGSGAGINQNGSGGTLEYIAGDFRMPALTQTAGTLNAYGTKVTTPATITTGGTAYGDYISATGVGAGTLNGIGISGITAGAGTEYALNIGSGWDAVLRVGSTTIINGSGVTLEAGGGTGQSTYATGDILYASGANTLAKRAIGNADEVLTVVGGVPTWTTISGASCTNCLVDDPTADQIIAPTGQGTTGLAVRQTSTASPTDDIFQVTSSDGSTKYFYVDKDGNVSTTSTAGQTLTLTPATDTTALTLVGTNVTSQPLQYINAKNSSAASGILNMAYGAAQTLSGAIIGFRQDLSTNVTATNQSVTGYEITLPGATNTSGTQAYTGISISGGSINENGGTATTFTGASITIPAITQTSGTLTAYGTNVTTPSSITTAGTAYGYNVSATGVGAGSLYGLNISNITPGAGTEVAAQIGSGWDTNLLFNDTTTRVAIADGGTLTILDSAGNSLCTITDNSTVGDLSCTGTISGSGSVGYWARSGSTLTTTNAGDNVTVDGAFTANGTTTLGNATSDTITLTGYIGSNMIFSSNDTYDIGDTTHRLNDLFLGSGSVHIGTSTTDEGTISYDTSGNILNFGTDSTTNGDIAFFTNDLYLDKSAGSIGINNTAPASLLDITGTQNATLATIRDNVAGNTIAVSSTYTDSSYTPLMSWYTTDNNPTKTKISFVGTADDANGSGFAFYTSSGFSSGSQRVAISGCYAGKIGLGTECDTTASLAIGVTSQTTGNFITTSPTSVLTGSTVGFNGDYTGTTATGQNFTGYRNTLPAVTNTGAGTYVYKGIELTGGAITQTTAAGTNTYTGLDITNSNLTQTTGTLTSQGVQVTTGSNTTGGTQYGINLAASGVGAGTLTGINISAITAGAGTETALVIGSGWDNVLDSSTVDISGAGAISGATGISSSGNINFSTLSASSAVYTDGSKNLTSTAPTSGTIGYWSRSGSTLSPATSGDAITTSGNISTSSSGTITSAGTLTASNGFTMTTGALSLTSTSGAVSSTGLTGLTYTLSSGTAAITAPTLNLNTSSTGNTAIGNATGTFALTSNGGLNVTTGGALTGVASIDTIAVSATALTFAGAGTISSTTSSAITLDSGSTGAVNLGTGNNAKTLNIGTGNAGNTINIGTNNTVADAINIGSALDTTTMVGILSLTGADTSLFDLSAVNVSSTSEGLKLPQNTSCASGTAEGQVCWDTDNNTLYIGDGATATAISGGASTWSDITSPTADQTLTFDDGEQNIWTINSDTETFWSMTADSMTTGKLFDISLDGLTSGTGLQMASTSTALTGTAGIGSFINLDWSPGSSTLATGDLFALNIGSNGTTTGNLFNILDSSSSIFSVSETSFTTSLPSNFTSAGDISAAYDLNFTNPTASYIKSQAPLSVVAGETFGSSNLTLGTYNQGTIVFSTNNTTTTAMDFTSNTLTTGTGLNMSFGAITTGTGLALSTSNNTHTTGTLVNIASSSTAQTSPTLLNVAQTGATTGLSGGAVVAVSTTASTNSGARGLTVTANSMTTGVATLITANALTSGHALSVASSSTGNLSQGLVRFNASGAHSGTAFQLLSGAAGGGAMSITTNSITTGTALTIASSTTGFSSGGMFSITKTGASGTTAFTGDIANIAYSHTYSGGTVSHTGNLLDMSRSLTLNAAVTHTVSGALMTIADALTTSNASATFTYSGDTVSISRAATRTSGSITNSGNILTLTSSDASHTGAALNIASSQTAPATGVAVITANSATTGDILSISGTALTTGSALVLTGPTSTGVTDNFIKVSSDIGADTILANFSPDFNHATGTGYGLAVNATDSTTNTTDNHALFSSLSITGNAARTNQNAIRALISSTSTSADTLSGVYITTSVTGAIGSGTRNVYGVRSEPTVSNATAASSTTNVYGVYAKASGNISSTGAINSYGLYVANGAYDAGGTNTAYGIYLESITGGDTGHSIYSAGGNNTFIGRVGVGVQPSNYNLQVEASVADYLASFINSNNTTSATVMNVRGGDNTSGTFMDFRRNDNTAVGSITFSGGNTTAYNTTSDRRLKTDIADTQYGLSDLLNINVNDFRFISDPSNTTHTGFMAQDLYNIYPEAVTVPTSEDRYWQVDYGKVTPLIVKSVQELNYKVENALLTIDPNGQANGNLNVEKIVVSGTAKIGGLVSASNFALDASLLNKSGAMASVPVSGDNKVTLADTVNSLNTEINTLDSRLQTLDSTQASQSAELAQARILGEQAVNHAQTLDEKVASTSANLSSLSSRIDDLLASLSGESTNSAAINDEPITINDLTPPTELIATDSATFKNIDITETLSTLRLSTLDSTISGTFKSLGETFLGQTTIAGDLSVDGTMSFTNGNSINAFPTLFFQNNPLAQAVDFFNGKITLNSEGRMAAESLALGDQSLGTATIAAGQTEITIPSELILSDSKIFLTPESSITGNIYVGQKAEGSGFKVKLSQPNSSPVKFNWMVIQSKETN